MNKKNNIKFNLKIEEGTKFTIETVKGAKNIFNCENTCKCLKNKEQSIISPKLWEIDEDNDNKVPDSKKKNLLVFNILPHQYNNENGDCKIFVKFVS
jgi:hypothetical protein